MDLLLLGAQSRKTGIKPKQNLPKDKFDMEDIDEFFEESSWSDAKSDTSKQKHPLTPPKNTAPAPKRTLGVRRMGLDRKAARQPRSPPKKSPEPMRIDHFETTEVTSEFPTPEHANQEVEHEFDQGFEFADQDLDATQNDVLLDSDVKNMTLSPIPLLSLGSKKETRGSKSSPKMSGVSRFTKNLILARKSRRPKITYLDPEDEEAEPKTPTASSQPNDEPETPITSSRPKDLTTQYSDDAFSDDDYQRPASLQSYSSSYMPTQQSAKSSQQSLPSPPPEGLRRSKRTKIAPLAYWRNEHIVYSRANDTNGDPDSTLIRDIRKVPLQEISEVVHVPVPSKQKSKGRRGRPPKHSLKTKKHDSKEEYDYASDPEIEGSEWYQKKSLEAEVFVNEDTKASRVVAFSPLGGDFQLPPPPKNGQLVAESFRVAPLFDANLDVIAGGLLDFPFQGFKSLRTTGESLFMFHVAKGLLEVTLNSDTFVVSRGCSFEVPRFNIYSFKNIGQGSARLFFVQCQLGKLES